MVSHIRFRRAWKAAGRTLDELPFKSQVGVAGSYFGVFIVSICLVASFYVGLFPIGSGPDAESFFETYLAGPIILALFVFWKLYKRQWWFGVKTRDMDLDTGRRDFDDLPPTDEETKRRMSVGRRVSRAVF